jgi:uncharacterized protein (DUF1697 family)
MAVVVSLLRGINLARHNRITMDDLKSIYRSAGISEARTYVQSGNVLFHAETKSLAKLAGKLQDGIEKRFGFRPDIVHRTLAELRGTISANPFAKREGIEPAKLAVTFLALDQAPDAPARIAAIPTDPEEMRLVGRDLFIYFPNGMGRAKLPLTAIGKVLTGPSTARNWNTVTKLVEIASEL